MNEQVNQAVTSEEGYNMNGTPFQEIRLNPNVHQEGQKFTLQEKFAALCVDKIDKLVIDTITEVAKDNGITSAYVFERGFILDALRHEIERRSACKTEGGIIGDVAGYKVLNREHQVWYENVWDATHDENGNELISIGQIREYVSELAQIKILHE